MLQSEKCKCYTDGVNMWKGTMLRSFPVDLLPLLPFSLEGTDPEIITELFEKLRQQSDPYLLGAAAEFASYVFDHYNKDQNWLFRKVQSMYELKDLPLYKALEKQVREELRQEVRQEERRVGLEAQRNLLVEAVEKRMPKLAALTREQVALFESPKVLLNLTIELMTAKTVKQARYYLLNWHELSQV
jgi:hypothetical protein